MSQLRTILAGSFGVAFFSLVAVVATLSLGLLAMPLASTWPGWWGRLTLALLGVKAEYRGLEHLRGGRSIIVIANHQSGLDVPVVAGLSPRSPLCLAKKELRWFPGFNLVWWSHGQVFVDRSNPARATEALEQVAIRCRREPRTVILAPEGTRSRDGSLGRFKLGAFRLAVATGAPIVPVVIRGAGALMPPGRWWVSPGTVTVEVKAPVSTEGWTLETLREHADALERDYRGWLTD